jgi:arsenate reductase
VSELETMLGYLKASGKTFRNVFNTSGEQYRALEIGERIKAGMTEQEAIALLSKNGKLIKRPFLLTDKGGATGFQAETWDALV